MPVPSFYSLLTTVGAARITNAQLLNQPLLLTEIAIGDGGGAYTNPVEADTALTNEVWRGAINSVTVDVNNPNWLVVDVVIPTNVGGWMVREVGLFDSVGNMIAIGQYPETYKPILAQGSGKELFVKMIVETSSASSVTLQIDPTVVLATRAYVDNKTITWKTIGAAYQSAAQDGLFVDTSVAAIPVTLPPAPAFGQRVMFEDLKGTFATNNLTVVRNGSLIMGLAEDMIVSSAHIAFGLIYSGAADGWRII